MEDKPKDVVKFNSSRSFHLSRADADLFFKAFQLPIGSSGTIYKNKLVELAKRKLAQETEVENQSAGEQGETPTQLANQ